MSIHVALNHVTHYKYDRLVSMAPHVIRLRPAPHARTPILAYSLKVSPEKHFLNWQQDPYSNYLARVVFPEKSRELRVEVDLVAELTVINPFDFFVESSAEKYPFVYEPIVRKELQPYLEMGPLTPRFGAFVEMVTKKAGRAGRQTIDVLVEMNQLVRDALRYDLRMEPGVQTPEETLTCGHGSCRDFTWLMVQLCRRMGLAARFVSGYSIQLVADVKSLDGPSGVAQDITDLHAWTEVYLPGAGWIGLDSTSGLLTGEGHIPLACTAEPLNAAPITGAVDKCEATFDFKMSVKRIYEDPRVTKPYTTQQWNEIEALGHLVDDHLQRNNVRLTMGGEPTFVSIDDREGAEWSTEAMGPNKRRLAGDLIARLEKRFAPGSLLHCGQGKWYPGEQLPRWTFSAYWRKDGVPVWRDRALLSTGEKSLGHTEDTAQAFIENLADRLGKGGLSVTGDHAIPAYEDVWYYMWKERRLPVNVDPLKNNLKDEVERARMTRVFENGLAKVTGYTLPLMPVGVPGGGEWRSGPWFLRSERMYLLPGDSPMGYRLPLDSLPWVAPGEFPYVYERDVFEELEELPDPRPVQRAIRSAVSVGVGAGEYREQGLNDPLGVGEELKRMRRPRPETVTDVLPARGQSDARVVRTALCAEVRKGVLHLFMPPVRFVEDYLELVARIEETASELETPVVIEGYAPPYDRRLNVIKATPDPGVIEVNIHPVHNWDEAVQVTKGLYEDGHYSRLGTEKFQLDGRHTGTGGGNHIVIGGATPADSPFLRRPDLLKSLVAYWHNHPSLSYLFSGMFVGPTSQAPRADEGRTDNLYELELAMRQIPVPHGNYAGSTPAWLVDRIFRHLLVDLTGNTHRAEFCIDKLYSPDSSTGRLGLVEFRGFEMPPHAEMSLTQQLLLRALVARFWEHPYNVPLVRWGNELHDRFMLPHFVAEDFRDVLNDTAEMGFPIQHEWFRPHFEFRFPIAGMIDVPNAGGIHLELRNAIEPWYVLGEEPAGGGTSRFVDSSVERMQVKATGLINTRHAIAVNGVTLPLHPTGRNGEYVVGVRYRAWQPPSCLHPTIGVHTPLVFDIIDTWNKQAVGGCTYHVSHPGGRAHESFPVNALEAEGRRIARFFKFGHTPGTMMPRVVEKSLEFPLTLDLRRV